MARGRSWSTARAMGPTSTHYPNRTSVLRMADRIGIAFEGWLYALPFVLTGPVIFWLLFAPSQMSRWSWQAFLEVYDYGLPMIGGAVFGHLFAFLITGLPLFLIFWGNRSIIWHLPVSLLLGGALAALTGIPFYWGVIGGMDLPLFFVCLGYGFVTAFGCWLANRRNEKSGRKANRLRLSVTFCLILVLGAGFSAFA